MVTPRAELARRLLRRDYVLPVEAAFLFNRSKATINRWVQRGLRVHVVGGVRYVKASEVQEWMHDPANKVRRIGFWE